MARVPERLPFASAGASGGVASLPLQRGRLQQTGVFVASFVAFAVPISTAATSVGKVLVLILALAILLTSRDGRVGERLRSGSVATALALIVLIGASLAWTIADSTSAFNDVVKYGKLVLIPALIVLLPTRRDAAFALVCWGIAQIFVVLSSVLLGLGLGLPWVPQEDRISAGSVFTDYITQSIMTVTFAALCWVLRNDFPGRHGRKVAMVISVVSFINILYFLPGRSGWVIACVLITLIAWWELPRRFRGATVVLPVCIVGLLLLTSDTGRIRLSKVIAETGAYVEQGVETSSSGERLNFWRRSVKSIAARPVLGSGVGSWQAEYHRLENGAPPENTRSTRNPHNEYLSIGVQAGIPGMLLFAAFLIALLRDAARFDRATGHAVVLVASSLAVASLFNSALFDGGKGNFFCIIIGLLFAWGNGGRFEQLSPGRSEDSCSPSRGAGVGVGNRGQSVKAEAPDGER